MQSKLFRITCAACLSEDLRLAVSLDGRPRHDDHPQWFADTLQGETFLIFNVTCAICGETVTRFEMPELM